MNGEAKILVLFCPSACSKSGECVVLLWDVIVRFSSHSVCTPAQWFWLGLLCNGTARRVFTEQIIFCAAVFAPLFSYTLQKSARTIEKCYFNGSTEQSMRKVSY
jgi:hypothetical protein